jgi:hypothetical protein
MSTSVSIAMAAEFSQVNQLGMLFAMRNCSAPEFPIEQAGLIFLDIPKTSSGSNINASDPKTSIRLDVPEPTTRRRRPLLRQNPIRSQLLRELDKQVTTIIQGDEFIIRNPAKENHRHPR